MTHLPDLERELLGAARRRYPPAGRRRAGFARPRLRRLVPVAAAVLALAAGATALRSQDPEVEAPAGPPATTLEELAAGPLGPELGPKGPVPADVDVPPVSLRVRDDDGVEWVAAAYAGPGGVACFVATLARTTERTAVGGTNCVAAGILGRQVTRDDRASFAQPGEATPGRGGSRIVYGVAGPDAESAEVTLGPATRRATFAPGVLEIELDETQREMARAGRGGAPDLRATRLRLFAAAFTEREVPDPIRTLAMAARVTYRDGETLTHRRPSQLEEDRPSPRRR